MTNINIDRRLAVIVAVGLNLIIYLFYQVVVIRADDLNTSEVNSSSSVTNFLTPSTEHDNKSNSSLDESVDISADVKKDNISDYLNGVISNKDINISNLTNNVVYDEKTDKFVIPAGTREFEFHWDANSTTDGKEYSGTYKVYLNSHDVVMTADPTTGDNKNDVNVDQNTKVPNKNLTQDLKDSTNAVNKANEPSLEDSFPKRGTIIMFGNVYSISGPVEPQKKLRMESSYKSSIAKYNPNFLQPSVKMLPEAGNKSGDFLTILGMTIGILTVIVIDIRKTHQYGK